ncbi:MAG: GWxTD domain-containing protein [bacterium]
MKYSGNHFLGWAISQGLRVSLLLIFLLIGPNTVLSNTNDLFDKTIHENQSYAFEFLTFKTDENQQTFLEIFCQIPLQNLQHFKSLNEYLVSYHLDITLFDENQIKTDGLNLIDSVKVEPFNSSYLNSIPHLVRFTFLVNPGEYTARVKLIDRETMSFFSLDKDITIPNYSVKRLIISDIQMATSIAPSQQESILVKNEMKIIPNVSHVFGISYKTLFLYSEIYHLKYQPEASNNMFTATYTIFNQEGQVVKSLARKYKKPGPSSALSIGIPISELASGQYTVTLTIQDPENGQSALNEAKFTIVKPLSEISDEEYATLMRQLQYIATEDEIEYLKSLPADARLSGLNQFWTKLDPTQDTDRNELMVEYFQRIYYANQHFQCVNGSGWETDQGQIYLKNGPPDFIKSASSPDKNKSFEVWEYFKLNSKYVFVDEWGLGQFRLLRTSSKPQQGITLF